MKNSVNALEQQRYRIYGINSILKLLMKLTNEVVNESFEPLLSGYQIGLEKPMRGSDFVFDSVQLLYHKCHKMNFECER